MKIIYKPRGTGKTTDLIKISSETHIPIICFSFNEARLVRDMAHEMGLDIPTPIGWDRFMQIKNGTNIQEVLVDNLDIILSRIIPGIEIKVATVNEH